jgi:hypothetical protein
VTGLGSAGITWRLLDDAAIVGNLAVLPPITFPAGASAHGRGTGTSDDARFLISSDEVRPASVEIDFGAFDARVIAPMEGPQPRAASAGFVHTAG